ncbi:MAG: hypothetical protein N2442_05725 [Spirochaetes bacterium]|nr:hypothetical protein [Spirochaetota bacterium]
MFSPAFCPNPSCVYHSLPTLENPHRTVPFVRIGFYHTLVVGNVPRYRCKACGKTFGVRTFQLDYYAKRSLPYQSLHQAFYSGQNLSSIARLLHCSPASIQNRLDRLSRNAILLHQLCLRTHQIQEDLTADGYERFDRNQFFPNNINLTVGKDSQFIYGISHATLRRKGTMRPEQKAKRKTLESQWKPPRGTLSASFAFLLQDLSSFWNPSFDSPLTLYTDEHPVYPIALRKVPFLKHALSQKHLSHTRISSKLPRTVQNPLFPSNYMDRELTKDIAAYHRESVCFVRNVNNGLSRLLCYLLYHNYQKPYRIHWGALHFPSHAQVAGIPSTRFKKKLERVYDERFFLTQNPLTPLWEALWFRRYKTPLKMNEEYLPKYTYKGYTQASIK